MRAASMFFLLLFQAAWALPLLGAESPAFVAEARKAYFDGPGTKLKSLSADLTLRSSPDPKVMAVKDKICFSYAWTAPGSEDFAMREMPPSVQNPVRKRCKDLWKDLTGSYFFIFLSTCKNLTETVEGDHTVLSASHPVYGKVRADFTTADRRIHGLVLETKGGTIDYRYVFKKVGKFFFIQVKDIRINGKRKYKFGYSGLRSVNEWTLPTLFTVEGETPGRATTFDIKYVTVNGVPAVMGPLDSSEVDEAVKAFKKSWGGWDLLEKVTQIRKLAELDHDKVSATIAKYGLNDREISVRIQAAKSLGEMKRNNVTLSLLTAMKSNAKTPDVYIAIIQTLGHIGDVRAIPLLSKGWWNQNSSDAGYDAARAKIDALGGIRDRRSIDGILDTFYMAPDWAIGQVAANIINSLRRLTGQDFGRNRRAWKDWWKKNRAQFRFE